VDRSQRDKPEKMRSIYTYPSSLNTITWGIKFID
jgi:hypothetical protein